MAKPLDEQLNNVNNILQRSFVEPMAVALILRDLLEYLKHEEQKRLNINYDQTMKNIGLRR